MLDSIGERLPPLNVRQEFFPEPPWFRIGHGEQKIRKILKIRNRILTDGSALSKEQQGSETSQIQQGQSDHSDGNGRANRLLRFDEFAL
jgi:hypothetical protein